MKDKIVVFDSGLGGLNIFNALRTKYPNENYVYIADELNLPYGTKSIEFLKKRIKEIIEYFKDSKAIVIACNTASSIYGLLEEQYDNVYEIIRLTSIHAENISKNKKIGVIATNLTIELGKYQEYLTNLNTTVYPLKYSELVDIIESKNILTKDEYSTKLNESLKEKFTYFNNTNIDTLICGCTHFGYVIDYYKKYLGNINYLTSDEVVVNYLNEKLDLNKVVNPTTTIYTTGDPVEFKEKMKEYNCLGVVNKIII